MPERPYIYYDFTQSICSTCLRRVDAKIVFEQENVFMLKTCKEHGFEKVLISTDKKIIKTAATTPRKAKCPIILMLKPIMDAPMIVVYVRIMNNIPV